MPRLIRKYGNRRMYDTKTSHPVTLPELADLIKKGEKIQVMGHQTGKDLTSVTLIQILLGQEKDKKEPFLALLRELIKKSGSPDLERLSVGLFAALNNTPFSAEKTRRVVEELVDRKRLSETQGEILLGSLATRVKDNRKVLEREIEVRLRKKMKDIENLYRREILELRKNVESLRELLGQRPRKRLPRRTNLLRSSAKRRL